MIQALKDAFLGFDATIATKEVMDILKELAGTVQDIQIIYLIKIISGSNQGPN